MAVYDVSYLDREIHTKGTMLLEEIERANRLARRVGSSDILTGQDAPDNRSDEMEFMTSARGIKKENIDPAKGSKEDIYQAVGSESNVEAKGCLPDEKMHVMLGPRTDSFYSDDEDSTQGAYMNSDYHRTTDNKRYHRGSVDSFYSRFCRDQKISLPQHGDRAYEPQTIEVHIPEASLEGAKLSDEKKQSIKISPKGFDVFHSDNKSDLIEPGFLEAQKAEQLPFDNFDDIKKEGFDNVYNAPEEELVYVESQPVLPAPIDHVSLKYTANGDKCTVGEVAEKVMEINVDDPYDLCSLLAAEKKDAQVENVGSGRKRNRKMLYSTRISSTRRNKSLLSTMLPKGKESRIGKLKVFNYPYKCSRCDSWFVDCVDLKVHMSTHKEKSFKSVKDFIHEKIFKKPGTEKSSVSTPTYSEPEVTIIKTEPILLAPVAPIIPVMSIKSEMTFCTKCNMQFKSSSDLANHLQIHKHDVAPVPVHMVKHTKVASTNNPYKCTSCPASFGTSFNLKRHMRIHTGTRPYKCNECHSAFITKAQLTTHMRTHTGEKPYKCHICGGKFIQQNNLKRHIMTHTGEKPFKCDKCSAAFISSSDLKRHIRVHTGEKPYKCLHCNKGFTTSGNLSSHYKMHTGEKPYKCHLCDASFSHQSNLKTHVKRHAVSFKCACGEGFSMREDLMEHMKICKNAGDVSVVDGFVDESSSSS